MTFHSGSASGEAIVYFYRTWKSRMKNINTIRLIEEMTKSLSEIDTIFHDVYLSHMQQNDYILSYVLLGEYYDAFCMIQDSGNIIKVLAVIEAFYLKGNADLNNAIDISFLEQYVIDERELMLLPPAVLSSAKMIKYGS